MMCRELRILELKERITPTYLETVSVFANYGTGKVVFRIGDDGLAHPAQPPLGPLSVSTLHR